MLLIGPCVGRWTTAYPADPSSRSSALLLPVPASRPRVLPSLKVAGPSRSLTHLPQEEAGHCRMSLRKYMCRLERRRATRSKWHARWRRAHGREPLRPLRRRYFAHAEARGVELLAWFGSGAACGVTLVDTLVITGGLPGALSAAAVLHGI